MLRMFFLRIIEWDWPDAPARVPIFFGDVPKRDESLPRFLDDADYVKFMRALGDETRIHRRLAIELLARTGMRVGELCDLEADAVTLIGDAYWLPIPVGKLHNDRYVPLHPHLVELIATYRADTAPRSWTAVERTERGVGPLRCATLDRLCRKTGRDRTRPPAQAPTHAGHPGNQPGHVDRSNRRAPRTPIVGHDPPIRAHIKSCRR